MCMKESKLKHSLQLPSMNTTGSMVDEVYSSLTNTNGQNATWSMEDLKSATSTAKTLQPQYGCHNSTPALCRLQRKTAKATSEQVHKRHFVQHNYHDHSNELKPELTKMKLSNGKRAGNDNETFPFKLHKMLEYIEDDPSGQFSDVISWRPHGRAFIINKPHIFVDDVLPRFFKQTKLTSFQRQLNLYGFERLTRGDDAGAYYHELFLRGREFLVSRMVRTKVKGTGYKAAANPEHEPNFYEMPFVRKMSDSIRTDTKDKCPVFRNSVTADYSTEDPLFIHDDRLKVGGDDSSKFFHNKESLQYSSNTSRRNSLASNTGWYRYASLIFESNEVPIPISHEFDEELVLFENLDFDDGDLLLLQTLQ